MKKIIISLLVVAVLCATLTACAPGKPSEDEAKAVAEEQLGAVMGVFQPSKFVLTQYSDGSPMEYEANGVYYYLIDNFSSIFNSEKINADQIIALKKSFNILMTESNGVFIKKENYIAISQSKFTGEYEVKVDSISKNTINCTVSCKYSDNTTKDYPCVISRYYRTVTGDNNKTSREYFWSISAFFNPFE